MKVYWKSCPEYSMSDVEFWSHEWSKHGTCSGKSEYDFFSAALSLRGRYASQCGALAANAVSCEFSCSGATGPCSPKSVLIEPVATNATAVLAPAVEPSDA